jgi:molybdenum-dependent DNA-binding transcriptional regulator ModE
MSQKERDRLGILGQVRDGYKSLKLAAQQMQLCYRQAKRVWQRFRQGGEEGLVHRGRGRASNRRIALARRETILSRYRERYQGFGPTLAAEKLSEEGLGVNVETLRLWLMQEGLWERHRRRSEYRQRREPRGRFGELVQLDGSHHRWFEDRGDYSCLMNMVDDATKTTQARMEGQETTEGAMRLLWGWIERYGIPMSLYTDQKNVFVTDRQPTLEEQLAGQQPLTAFGIACQKLGIEIITAYSPQAKGRVERSHGVFQDRLVKELRLGGISSIAEANELLQGGFVEKLNRKFSIPPRDPQDAHVPLLPGVDLRCIFCFERLRTVSNDWVVRHNNCWYQLQREARRLLRLPAKVTVAEWLDGSVHILAKTKDLPYMQITNQVLDQAKKKAG